MKSSAIATSDHDGKTDPPPPTIDLGEPVENIPRTPMTQGTAAELAHELKKELEVANEHWKTVNAKPFELVQVEEEEKKMLSGEVSRLREDGEKMKEYVVSIENELGKLHKFVRDGNKKFYPEE